VSGASSGTGSQELVKKGATTEVNARSVVVRTQYWETTTSGHTRWDVSQRCTSGGIADVTEQENTKAAHPYDSYYVSIMIA